ncbi:hypothetical protein BT96DRAFT_984722 [Gymnopus androsaceus JB14]|uniref:PXA domain-containing protein n=1 Tax=Gymnopus androsaceus JB14 TaxID=1447944 RepID=A0A6A4IBY5_9AGAR|nr:hypothetical protein BT96DRAFT_984722 [Gymnopus androsaceus JB14]
MSRNAAPSMASNSNSSHATNYAANKSVPLAKRLLFPTAPASSFDFPPLFLTTVPPELDAELYDVIALALRAFVQPWWTKITRYDKEFLPIITEILTQVFRTFEERLAQAQKRGDVAELAFKDIPLIITQHYHDFRTAQSKLNSSYAAGGALSLPILFHASQSHIAVKPGGEIDLDYVRFLVDHILKTCLPKQDWDPEAERVIVREIIVKIVAKDILGKITQPWFIEKLILDQLMMNIPSTKSKDTKPHQNGFSLHSALIAILTLIQSISGFCLALAHAYRQAVVTIKEVNQHSDISESAAPTPPPAHPQEASSSLPPFPFDIDPLSVSQTPSERSTPSPKHSISSSSNSPEHIPFASTDSSDQLNLLHDLATYPLLMLTEVFTTDSRFASSTIMSTAGMVASQGVAGRWFDKFLPYLLTRIMSASLIQTITRSAKRTLFPNGYPAPPPIDPTPEEQAETRRRLVNFLDGYALAPLLLGPHPSDTISAALEPLESRECNVHLIMILLDRILGVLFPELFDGTG